MDKKEKQLIFFIIFAFMVFMIGYILSYMIFSDKLEIAQGQSSFYKEMSDNFKEGYNRCIDRLEKTNKVLNDCTGFINDYFGSNISKIK